MSKRKKRGTVSEINESDGLDAIEVKPSRSQMKRAAWQRQLKYLAGLLRQEDWRAIEQALADA